LIHRSFPGFFSTIYTYYNHQGVFWQDDV
jgi:hypothetical protein